MKGVTVVSVMEYLSFPGNIGCMNHIHDTPPENPAIATVAPNTGSAYVYNNVGSSSSVPEVSATGCLAALVTLFGLIILLWERRRLFY
jgi:hypothetical protein